MLRALMSAGLVVGLLAPLPVPADEARTPTDAIDLDAIPPPRTLPPQTAKVETDAVPERKRDRLGPRDLRVLRELRRARNERRREREESGLTRLPPHIGTPGPGRATPVKSPDAAFVAF